MSKVTIADVAKEAGLSKTAVSFALNDNWKGKLSVEAANRAKSAAEKLGYRPNHSAKALRSQSTASLGFLSTQVSVTRFAMDMISGAISAANENDHALLVGETAPKDLHVEVKEAMQIRAPGDIGINTVSGQKALSALLDRQIDGLIVAEMRARKIMTPELPENLPVVYLNCAPNFPAPVILPDETSAGEATVETLINQAKPSKVMLIGTSDELETKPELSITIGERISAIRKKLREHDLETLEMPGSHWSSEFGYEVFIENYTKHKPDAVIALNDQIGFGVYQACSDLGIKVGEDISLISFDDDELSRLVRPGLSTAALPYEEMGRLAVELVLGGKLENRVYKVQMPIKHRASIRQIPS